MGSIEFVYALSGCKAWKLGHKRFKNVCLKKYIFWLKKDEILHKKLTSLETKPQ